MNSSLYGLWSVLMTIAALLLVPNLACCHLSSALKAGAEADGKPPILNHVRVSREPQPRISRSEFESPLAPLIQTSKIKSPSYQHKVLQFHSNAQTSSGQELYPGKFYSSGAYPSLKSLPVYPVASKFGKVDTRQLLGQTSSGAYTDDMDLSDESRDSWENTGKWEPNLLPEPEEPTFTPFIGARALTNMPGFFQHLKENINAIYENKGRHSVPSSPPHQDQVMTEREGKDEEEQEGLDKMIATPTRRGYSSNSEAESVRAKLQPDGMRQSRSGGPYTIVFQNQEPDPKTKELLHFLGHGKPEYPRANRYNPAFLFTNLGLGKRNSHEMYKQYLPLR